MLKFTGVNPWKLLVQMMNGGVVEPIKGLGRVLENAKIHALFQRAGELVLTSQQKLLSGKHRDIYQNLGNAILSTKTWSNVTSNLSLSA